MSKLAIFYLVLSVGSVGSYGYLVSKGWEHSTPEARLMPSEARRSPGGYRSFHFWHVGYGGYRGGK